MLARTMETSSMEGNDDPLNTLLSVSLRGYLTQPLNTIALHVLRARQRRFSCWANYLDE
jgi:hypothetical protein